MRTVPTLCDARGKQSVTLFFVAVSWLVLIIKFLAAGLDTPFGQIPDMNAADFGLAAVGILGAWVGREYTEKQTLASQNQVVVMPSEDIVRE